MSLAPGMPAPGPDRFLHDAFFYDDLEGFVEVVGDFVRDGLAAGDAVLVATDLDKCDALRAHLGRVEGVSFVDMAEVGRNPGRIIPVWREFTADAFAAGRGVRGVGEPVWAERGDAELLECQHHETMLNLAFDDGPGWMLLCPYDVSSLPEPVLQEALRSHPHFVTAGGRRGSSSYVGEVGLADRLAEPLDAPPTDATVVEFAGDGFAELRDEVMRRARRAHVPRERLEDLGLAIHELATNSVRHGGGGGTARIWRTSDAFVVEIADTGHIADPLVGRSRPALGAEGGRGLWMVHLLCDLVQVRTGPAGTTVRVTMSTTTRGAR